MSEYKCIFYGFFYILAWLTNDLLATEKKIIIFINLPSLWIKYTLKKKEEKNEITDILEFLIEMGN